MRSLDLSHPMQEAQAILKVLKEFLAETQWDSPLTRFEIEITDVVPWSPGQLMLFDSGENRFHDLADFVARLRAKLGDESVGFANFEESYLPEHSWRNVWPPCLASPALFFPERPLFLFSPPKRCPPPTGWSLSHSEDVASAWWEAPVDRSYYVAKNSEGEFLWIYFDNLRKEWFLHGVFD